MLELFLNTGRGLWWQDDENQRSSRVSAALCVSKMPERTRMPEVSTRRPAEILPARLRLPDARYTDHTAARGAKIFRIPGLFCAKRVASVPGQTTLVPAHALAMEGETAPLSVGK